MSFFDKLFPRSEDERRKAAERRIARRAKRKAHREELGPLLSLDLQNRTFADFLLGMVIEASQLEGMSGEERRDYVVEVVASELDRVTSWRDAPLGRLLEQLDGHAYRALLRLLVETAYRGWVS